MFIEIIRDSITIQCMFYTFIFASVFKTVVKYLPNITEFIKQLRNKDK